MSSKVALDVGGARLACLLLKTLLVFSSDFQPSLGAFVMVDSTEYILLSGFFPSRYSYSAYIF